MRVVALPLLLAFTIAVILARPMLSALRAEGHIRPNYRARELPYPFGVLIPIAALLALVPLILIERITHATFLQPQLIPVAMYALGVACLGLIDDTLGGPPGAAPGPRGWRGHGGAALRGELSTGTVKAVGSLGLALLATSYVNPSIGRWLLAAAVLVLATNALNLLDLRPGRAIKGFVLIGVGLTIGVRELRPLWTLGLFVGPALVAGAYDLREEAMLGDTGANLLGALAGLWLVITLGQTGQLIALALLLVVTVYGELRSISELVARVPLLRELDSFGRPSSPPR
jgi:UDP-N-acetylmuramyl pentapeptide phosphotransferase/UDP-N-acetylglucosamine-1-phosphate transferase